MFGVYSCPCGVCECSQTLLSSRLLTRAVHTWYAGEAAAKFSSMLKRSEDSVLNLEVSPGNIRIT
jgi:hypothetical protein